MNGITGYGVYLPYFRLGRSDIAAALGEPSGGRGTRSVASYDEDPISMGVEAARAAIRGTGDGFLPKRLLFSTTVPPYCDKTNATIIHAALNLDPDVMAVDMIGSARSGIGSLVWGMECPDPVLAVLSDIRTGLPGGADERDGGDAAAAFAFGGGPVIAEVLSYASSTEEFLDRWRTPGAKSSRLWEERFGEFAYNPLAESAFADALKKANLVPGDIDTLVVAGTHARAVRAFAASSGVSKVGDDLSSVVGNAGTAQAGLVLARALDQAASGEVLALVVLADGATAIVLRVTEEISRFRAKPTVDELLSSGGDSLPYTRFLAWRGMLEKEPPRRPDPVGPAAPPSLRSTAYKHAFIGHRCTECGTVHLPAVRVCVTCKSIDRMVQHPMANVPATVATYTIDRLAYSPSPPVVAAVVDFDGGGRFSCQLTDVDPSKVRIGDRVEMTFRKLVTAGGVHNYFWKARPLRCATAEAGTANQKGS